MFSLSFKNCYNKKRAAQSLKWIKSMSRETTQDYYTIKSRVDFDMETRGI